MIQKSNFWKHTALILSAAFLIVSIGCDKEDDDTDDNGGNGNGEIDFDINYGSVTDIDGNEYKTITIGAQEWMAENLKVTRYNNGDSIPFIKDNNQWSSTTDGAYSFWNNDSSMLESYGLFYNWHVVNDIRKVCPSGWHVPSKYEWEQLGNYLIDQYDVITSNNVGNKLKSCRQDGSPLGDSCDTQEHPRWSGHSTHYGTNDFGFSGLPAGYRKSGGNYNGLGFGGFWFTTNELTGNTVVATGLTYDSGDLEMGELNKNSGACIRCIKD
ncbi:MAG: fibrobacter succinogenes major paralogous domain-containing protein [Bacteroidales bacterium]|nr:fibrobacter succinogenes major paralogous domain-containing protein [Bacteroidales bacterium]MCF8327960.1 fibrobacter succinogenes major paralogous domain-containing protein [Bacteroidales bacterium]